ncbi:MAG TPA: RusA family crossover junction endodeoxyribonuclease [bacterium]|nr:RusA family crossover junction endodeoxyribonuclease [bacterium]
MPAVLPSKAYLKWEKEARIYLWENLPDGLEKPLEGLLHVKALIYYKGPMPDLSGAMESIGDCLEKIAYIDDKQIMSWDGSRLIHDLKNPRTEVWIETFNE